MALGLTMDEIQQVKRYATKVMDNRYFDKAKTKWTFIAVSDDIADDAIEDVTPRDRKPGHVHLGKAHDIWVVRWSEVIQQANFHVLVSCARELARAITRNGGVRAHAGLSA